MGFLESILYMTWRGVAIGLIISAPMGPVGMLCIQRTLDKGRRAGFYTGIGAALSDLFYALLTGFGLSFIEEFLEKNQNVIQLTGSAVLIAFGIYLFRKNPAKSLRKPMDETVSVKKNILSGFLFTFSNPLILFLIIGLFARFNFLLPEFKLYQYFAGFVFIFSGAILWWWLITFSIDKVRSHFNIRSMWLINRIIGIIILLFAVVGIFTATAAIVKGFFLSPGASVSTDELRLSTTHFYNTGKSPWADTELLQDYLDHSNDPLEGYLRVIDRSLEESLIRMGGDYRFALVRGTDGYDLIYLSGARITASRWSPGMEKAHFSPSGIEGVWDVVWTDSMHQPLNHGLKAQIDDNGSLAIQFPYQDSQLRLHPSSSYFTITPEAANAR